MIVDATEVNVGRDLAVAAPLQALALGAKSRRARERVNPSLFMGEVVFLGGGLGNQKARQRTRRV
jgi:hypothetical protein